MAILAIPIRVIVYVKEPTFVFLIRFARNFAIFFIKTYTILQLLIHLVFIGSFFFGGKDKTDSLIDKQEIVLGAERKDLYYPRLKDKSIGMVVNHTSMIGKSHLVDQLVADGFQIKTIFAPEHGFRGNADAGEVVKDGKDVATGLPIISLYGKNKKPTAEQLKGIDVVIFDIQDVGVRFYT